MSMSSEALTVAEVAALLRVSKAHVCKVIRGQVQGVTILPAIPLGRRLIIRRSTLEQWMHENEHPVGGGILPTSLEVDAVDA